MWILVFPIVIVLLGVSFVVLIALRKWKLSCIIGSIAIVINWQTECFSLNVLCNTEKQKLRLLSYNLNGCLGAGSYINDKNNNLADLVSLMDSINADVVLLQEYYQTSNQLLIDSLKKRYNFIELQDSLNTGKAFFSKFPLKVLEYLPQSQSYVIEMEMESDTLYLINCYLHSNGISRVNSQEKYNGMMDLLGKYYADMHKGYNARHKQATEIGLCVKNISGNVIVCGDLNDIGGSRTISSIKTTKMRDAWWQAGCGYGHTYHLHNLYFRLDHCLYSGKIRPVRMKVIQSAKYSDHYPVVIDFTCR